MLELNEQHSLEYEKSMLGRTLEILLEEEIEQDGHVYYVGHSREYIRTVVEKQDGIGVNDIVSVRAEAFSGKHVLLGKLLSIVD